MQAADDIAASAELLDYAALNATAVPQLASTPPLSVADAYRIQRALLACRESRGEHIVGIKMGFTSTAKMQQMGVSDQIFGLLTDAMQIENGASISLKKYIHARCEPELAFRLKHALPAHISAAEALHAIEAVAPAIEIIDSRYADFRFSLTDVIADNASSSGYVLGPWSDCPTDLSQLAVTLTIDHRLSQSGGSADILGNPLLSLVAAARLAGAAGRPLQAGWIVLAGAATATQALTPGSLIEARVATLGAVSFSVQPD